ncbi:N-acetylmuramic acid 6-phosphate etherase [Celeribacter sp.]|uniref:N-acetylmuramic acid 6-phosphate etherase n=1 Tax=Celeribacter sp. TaxID=1890673 RepID=UPI003A912D32
MGALVKHRTTEKLHDRAGGMDRLALDELAQILASGQREAAGAAEVAASQIASASKAMAETISSGGVLRYTAAGSSGLMAAADAMELGGTFSIPSSQVRIHMAGGLPTSAEMPGGTEDDTRQIRDEFADIAARDTVIAVSASGSTPFTNEAARLARAAGAAVIGIANNDGAELLALSDFSILLPTPPELVSGSTRMGAGTAQKIALNMLSTLMAVQLGHVYDGMMVNLTADNIKLRARARMIVSTIAEVDEDAAADAIERAQGEVKAAILIACGVADLSEARAHLNSSKGHLRPLLDKIKNNSRNNN